MANYMSATRTNWFRVTDENAYNKLIKGLVGEYICNEDKTDETGTRHFIGAYNGIDWYPPASENKELMEFIKDHKIYDENDMEINPQSDDINDHIYIYDKDNNMVYDRYDTDNDLDEFFSRLQKLLPDGEVFTYVEAGHEKLYYVIGFALVMTNKDIKSTSTEQFINETAKSLLEKGNTEI